MKKLSLFLMIAALTACQSGGRKEKVPATGFKPMAHTEEKLPNGLTVMWIPDEKLPYFSLSLMVASGSAADSKDEPGVAALTATLLDKGTSKKSATQIAADLEQLGLSFSAAADEDSTALAIEGLSLYSKEATESFFNLLTDAQFQLKEVEREKSLTRSKISKAMDRPSTVANMAFDKAVFGNHPYGLQLSVSKLSKITSKDLKSFHKTWYQPQLSYLAVVGRYTAEDQELVRKLFSSWKSSGTKEMPLPPPVVQKPSVLYVEKPGLQQAEIRIGHLGIKRNIPDYLKLRVANTILGESFIGRLFSEIREKRGLTYSIYSRFELRAVEGSFMIGTFTRLDKINETVKEVLGVYKNFTLGVTDQEVKDASSYLKGSFPQVIETGQDLAKQMLILKRYGVDTNYLATFMDEVSKVKPDDLNKLLKTYFRPADSLIVVYGPPGSDLGLEQFGLVNKIKYLDLVK